VEVVLGLLEKDERGGLHAPFDESVIRFVTHVDHSVRRRTQ
jgi:hypothetical protein